MSRSVSGDTDSRAGDSNWRSLSADLPITLSPCDSIGFVAKSAHTVQASGPPIQKAGQPGLHGGMSEQMREGAREVGPASRPGLTPLSSGRVFETRPFC